MTEFLLRVRVHDRPAALERVTALLRRRSIAVTRLSASRTGDPLIELAIRIDDAKTELRRVYRELLTLYDVVDVRTEKPDMGNSRELLLIRFQTNTAIPVPGRSIGPGLSEVIGTPLEIDAVLTSLKDKDVITGYVRSGELVLPDEVGFSTTRDS